MNELFLQELNAITNYANTSNTDLTEQVVRDTLTNLLNMRQDQLYGNRCRPVVNDEGDSIGPLGPSSVRQFLFKERSMLAKLFEEWCKDNNVDKQNAINMISWLYLMDLLDLKKIRSLMEMLNNDDSKHNEEEKERS